MKFPTNFLVCFAVLLSAGAWAQVGGPPLGYVAVADSFSLPPGMTLGSTSGVAINSRGSIYVLNRGPHPLVEFDARGTCVNGCP